MRVTERLDELEPRLSKVETEISAIKTNHCPSNDHLLQDCVSVCRPNDRQRRAKNVIIQNLPVSNHSSVADSKAHDADLVNDFLAHMNC